ncbi:MAG: GNAT family N-acetyltransferase, partial [Polyangiaceae bacterium]
MSELTLRLAVAEDSVELGKLAYQLVKLHHDFDPLRFIEIDDPNAPGYGRFLSSRANDPKAIVLVATMQENGAEKIVGYTY